MLVFSEELLIYIWRTRIIEQNYEDFKSMANSLFPKLVSDLFKFF